MATLTHFVSPNNAMPSLQKCAHITRLPTMKHMQHFKWETALQQFDTMEKTTNPRLRQIVRSLPRELLLYFEGSPVHNSFAHFFNVDTEKIYTHKQPVGNAISQVAFGLMGVAFALVTLSVMLNYSWFLVSLLP